MDQISRSPNLLYSVHFTNRVTDWLCLILEFFTIGVDGDDNNDHFTVVPTEPPHLTISWIHYAF